MIRLKNCGRHRIRFSIQRPRSSSTGQNRIEIQQQSRYQYAALELRQAIEAITYDRARSLGDEFPLAEYGTWQPYKVLEVLESFDPQSVKTTKIQIDIEDKLTGEIEQFVGTDYISSLTDLKKSYHKLGSYLHMPTFKNMIDGKFQDPTELKKDCEVLILKLEKVLNSQIFNFNSKTLRQ